MKETKAVWEKHYNREKSILHFPDENLVRMLAHIPTGGKALDFGSGSGRHIRLLQDFNYQVTASDISPNAIHIIKSTYPTANSWLYEKNKPFPFADNYFNLIVNWGVLHYNDEAEVSEILKEFRRVLVPGGYVLGSIRSDRDTHLNVKNDTIQLADLNGGYVKLYSLSEIKNLFQDFTETLIGNTERTIPGNLDKKICHWIFQLKN